MYQSVTASQSITISGTQAGASRRKRRMAIYLRDEPSRFQAPGLMFSSDEIRLRHRPPSQDLHQRQTAR